MKCYIKDYPRPQFVRTDWENLNGTWDFGFDDENAGEKEKWYQEFKGDKKINVPFTYETKLSGIQDETRHDFIWYHRTISVDGEKLEKQVQSWLIPVRPASCSEQISSVYARISL